MILSLFFFPELPTPVLKALLDNKLTIKISIRGNEEQPKLI